MVEIVLKGRVPSKKNQRINTRDGRSFPSKKFTEWQEDAMWAVREQTKERFIDPVKIDITLQFGDRGKADIDNRITSMLDMLCEVLLITDDRWERVPEVTARAYYEPKKWGAIIKIEPTSIDLYTNTNVVE